MSQFTGGGKPGWARPAGDSHIPAAQLPGFTGFGGVGSLGMMGVGVPMINQAAFSQPGMLGMGMMGAVAQQQRPAQAASGGMGSAAPAAGKNRTFVGVVTKMHDSYGFVDDDVFFQHTVIRGQHPRVGEKVMVEASYNPQMPFKWNAYRIQLMSGAGADVGSGNSHQQRASPVIQHPGNLQTSPPGGASRWGPSGAQDRHGAPRASPPRKVRSPARRSPRRSPNRAPRKRSPVGGSRRASPPNSRRNSPPANRKRERSPAPSTTSSLKRDSASPPRRRARIIPRYDFRHTKPVIRGDHNSVITIRSRYSKLYVPSDFVDLTADWPDRVPVESAIDMTNPVSFHVWHKDVDFPETDNAAILDPDDADSRHQVKVLLLAHSGKSEMLKKAFGLLPDGTTDDNHEVSSIFKQIQFLVGTRGKETMALGGSWSPSLDGADPTNPTTLIKTAIRTTKALTGVDLSGVPQWYSLVQLRYYRADKDRVDRVHLLWPDTQLLMPDAEQWESLSAAIRGQLETRLAAVDAQVVEGAAVVSEASKSVVSNAADVKESPEEAAEVKEEEGDEAAAAALLEKKKPKASHWNDLDVKIMKVAELKQELEARGLETRGIKTLLAQRLQEALDKEQELEEDGPPEEPVEVKKEEESEIMEIDSTPAEDGPEATTVSATENTQKSEDELKKEAEERQKKIEALEKEKKEKKASLEKHFALPKEPKIFVFPSKTYKSGKFDCKVTSLYNLLDYHHGDNKESQFEVSIFAEAFKELIERNAAFIIYKHMSTAADRESEKKRREEASKKEKPATEEIEKTEEEKEKSSNEKEKVEKIELKPIVSNRALFEACALFDANLCCYFDAKDIEELILNADLGVSRGMINKLNQRLCGGKGDRLTYRHLTDNLLDSNGDVRFEPGTCENAPDVEVLARGFGSQYQTDSPAVNGDGKISETLDGNVVINGNVINVPQKLALLKKSEQERDAAKSALNEQNSLLAQLKEAKVDLEKKKKDLEKELERTKKKLHDTNSSLKNSIDDASHLRSAVADCRRYAERIISMADKACPPPKKEEKEKKSEEKEKVKESSSTATAVEEKTESTPVAGEKTEDDGIPTGLVLSDEAGPEDVAEASEPAPMES